MLAALSSLSLVDTTGVDIFLAIEELANQYAQNTLLDLLDKVLNKLPIMDRYEILDTMGVIPITLEESYNSSNQIYTAKDYKPFKTKETTELIRVSSGISEEWDREAGGYYLQDFILLGGKRGSGKSIVCSNLVRHQHDIGNPSIYFTIEMTYDEVFQRILSAISGVPFLHLKKNETTDKEDLDLARAHASLFEGGLELFEKYISEGDFDKFAFQDELIATCKEKDEGRIIIVDDRNLSLATIDTTVAKYKAMYGDKLKLVVVDYINQVVMDGETDMYDWKAQTNLSKSMKNMARKHNILLVSPYQMDDSGNARFAKGLLDAPDLAQLIRVDEKDSNTILFETTKARSADDTGKYRVGIDWTILRIDPNKAYLPENQASDDDSEATSELTIG